MPPVIVAQNLYKRYEGFPPVLRGVNITVEPGEMVAIMGPSGCGKSTMLHVLGMLHAPDAGSLEILGADVLAFNREQTAAFRRGNMGFIMQASNLFDHSTVFENVEFPLIYEQVPPQERWERVIRALELVRLSARVHYRSNRLSGGEQQRVAIARAMVNNPRILLADEPTGALDAKTSRLIMENFRNLCHTGGVALVMVTHDPKMAEYCDSIYTLEDGVLQCRRHEPPPLPPQDAHNLLQGPAPVVRGALVAARFPEAAGQGLMYAAHRLHAAGLLSRIYALSESGFLSSPEGYALPLAVRRMGRLRCLGAFAGMLRHMRDTSAQVWELWRQRPGRDGRGWWAQLQAFCAGALLARWGVQDGIQFFYAAEARGPSTASWVAARLMRAPFAFAVRARDLAAPGSDWAAMVHDAAFVRCDTEATRAALIGLLPEAEGKAIVLRDPLTLTPPEDTEDCVWAEKTPDGLHAMVRQNGKSAETSAPLPAPVENGGETPEFALASLTYDLLRQWTGIRPPWGKMTGVRPVRLIHDKRAAGWSETDIDHFFLERFDCSEQKYQMAKAIADLQEPILKVGSAPKTYSLYIGIPFCPSRCSYCSFVSCNLDRDRKMVQPYVDCLCNEVEEIRRQADKAGLTLCSIYIGGGTPTSLSADQLRQLMGTVRQNFDLSKVVEYTVEAGRPDCTDAEKLAVIKEYGATRISINPQTFSDEVLAGIGRKHSAQDILDCYADARKAGHEDINMDLIASARGGGGKPACRTSRFRCRRDAGFSCSHTSRSWRGRRWRGRGRCGF